MNLTRYRIHFADKQTQDVSATSARAARRHSRQVYPNRIIVSTQDLTGKSTAQIMRSVFNENLLANKSHK